MTAAERLAQCRDSSDSAQADCAPHIIGWKIGYEIFGTTCIPEEAGAEALREAFVRYAEAHPARSDEPDGDVLRDALFARWPC